MAPNTPKPVVVLPAESPVRPAVLSVLAAAGFPVADAKSMDRAELAVVDLTSPEGKPALVQLLATQAGALLSTLVVVDGAEALSDLAADVADFVLASRIEEELPARLARARLRHLPLKEAQRRQRDLALLLKLTADYAESLDAEELLHDVTRRLADEMGIERAALVVVDELQGAGFIVAASDDASLKDLRIELARYPEIREVVRTGKPVIVEDAPSHPLLEGVKVQVAARGIQSIAALPLAVRGKVLGVLLVRASSKRGAFSSREIDFLATVAHSTAVALRNARHIETIRGQSEREKNARIAAEERAEDLKRYESYFSHLSDGIAIIDEQGRVLSLNPAGLALLDVSAKEAVGRHINALSNPSGDGLTAALLERVAKGEEVHEVDLVARTLSGRRLTLSVSAAPLRESGAMAILSFRDVTEARRMADELRQTKDFLERLIDSSVDAIIAADMKGKVVLFNKGAEGICGYTAGEALERMNVRDLYPKGQAREVMERLRSPEHGGRGRLSVSRQEILTKSGERVPVNMTASIIYEGEKEIATVGVFTDLRDRMSLERKLSDAQSKLQESEKNAVIVALAGTAAHELNQPLTSVMGYAELLRRKLDEKDFAYRPVDVIYREAVRMAEIVKKIGKITRYETKPYVADRLIIDIDKASSHEE